MKNFFPKAPISSVFPIVVFVLCKKFNSYSILMSLKCLKLSFWSFQRFWFFILLLLQFLIVKIDKTSYFSTLWMSLLMYCCLLWVINGSGVCKFEGCPLIEMKSRRGSLKYFSDFMVSSYLEISSHLNIKTSSWICYFWP